MAKPESMVGTPEYATWASMRQRCYNKKIPTYKNYGGRGITICERWRESFAAFYEDMGPRPAGRYSIDRINNDGNYEPSNCRWATQKEQTRNMRSNVTITIDGEAKLLTDWLKLGYSFPGASMREIRRAFGLPVIFNAPSKPHHNPVCSPDANLLRNEPPSVP